MGYIPAELEKAESGFEIDILGDRRKARLQHEPLFDPKRERMTG
jgi:dimethylglycine dehydrogenase